MRHGCNPKLDGAAGLGRLLRVGQYLIPVHQPAKPLVSYPERLRDGSFSCMRGLDQLESAGLISVLRKRGSSPVVTIMSGKPAASDIIPQ